MAVFSSYGNKTKPCVCVCRFRKQKRIWLNQRSTKRPETCWTQWSLKDDFWSVSVLTVRFTRFKCPFLFVRPCWQPPRQTESIQSLCWCNYFYCLLLTCRHVCSCLSCVWNPTWTRFRSGVGFFSYDFTRHTHPHSGLNVIKPTHTHTLVCCLSCNYDLIWETTTTLWVLHLFYINLSWTF